MFDFEAALKDIKNKGLNRELRNLETAQGPYSVIDGRRMLMMSSNNYLGLCNDIRLKRAAIESIRKFGVGAGGSRLTCGNFTLHRELEERLAGFKQAESSIIFGSGYAANIGAISGIADKSCVIFCDRLNHASIVDGIRLSGAKLVVYKHCDMDDLENKIIRYHTGRGLIATDGVFSMDGDIAPVDRIVKLAKKFNLMTMVDDAHATGVLGENGRGTLEYFGLKDDVDINVGTLSKAFGVEGGFVAGKRKLIDFLRHRAKSFIYSTALAPHNIAAAVEALNIIETGQQARKELAEKSIWLRSKLIKRCFDVPRGVTPIIPLMVGNVDTALKFSMLLYNEGIYIPAIRPPTVPKGTSRLRISLMASHSYDDMEFAVENLVRFGRKLGVIP
ncbi:8-amino-7-oxononanoate synthase [Acetivibrio mesophilus]|uniref:8-amino-7-ketopelargonate synthase n=1 Tax=Acetivibrio mesophilus TaxID=2487273 RepID=A0A4Q0I489_9FIRM|nr:8-amino-7-oxononanoate synthase [Acetivibrio mesophilus]ODM26136.1 8-amino-7-oxononanoate synthase [Clostridium sp. Bc-iso-3]RXE59104.1 8-amino-7-oxononanoate synthase [Acetivibrio mesophilus]HHV29511.1 8-amino-7-oxononanoate synthase [Clostridium sp.]